MPRIYHTHRCHECRLLITHAGTPQSCDDPYDLQSCHDHDPKGGNG